VEPQVVRYSERPELWEAIENLSDEVWPEYNQHGDTLNHYWGQLYDTFPEWQFVLYDPDEKLVLAETGDYVFPAGLATVHIDREADTGEYWEPNIWIIHGARGDPPR
jgi:hypothetical protein